MPHILYQLADAAADLLRANANNHTLRPAIERTFSFLFIRSGLLFSLTASSGHCDFVIVLMLLVASRWSRRNFSCEILATGFLKMLNAGQPEKVPDT